MALHELKTDTKVFQAVYDGFKSYEIRHNDRNFKVNDHLLLRETKYSGEEMKNGKPLIYTGRDEYVRVTYILEGPIYGLADNWVIMSFTYD